MNRKKPLPLTYFLGAIILCIALHFLVPMRQLLVLHWRFIGIVPLLLGSVLNLMADQALKKHNTTVKPFVESSALITTGVFRLTRNPMYLGMSLILLGIVLLLGSTTPFAVAIVLPFLFDRIFIEPEEAMLKKSFGDQFTSYQSRVRRWI